MVQRSTANADTKTHKCCYEKGYFIGSKIVFRGQPPANAGGSDTGRAIEWEVGSTISAGTALSIRAADF
jgi:hypothetical protein